MAEHDETRPAHLDFSKPAPSPQSQPSVPGKPVDAVGYLPHTPATRWGVTRPVSYRTGLISGLIALVIALASLTSGFKYILFAWAEHPGQQIVPYIDPMFWLHLAIVVTAFVLSIRTIKVSARWVARTVGIIALVLSSLETLLLLGALAG